jgi:hypothetical protein
MTSFDERRRARTWLLVTVAAIPALCLWQSLICWDSTIGCRQPWAVGFSKWASLYVGLLGGPFAAFWVPLPGEPLHENIGWTGVLTAVVYLLVVLSPYLYFMLRGRRSIKALALGAILWLVIGHYVCIGIWV